MPSTAGDAISVIDHGTEEGDGYTIENRAKFNNTHPNEDPLEDNIATSTVPHGIQEKVRQLCERKMYLIDEVRLPADDGKAIAEGIRTGTCAAVADGSFDDNKDNAGTAAFTIHANQGDRAPITGANWTTGRKQEQCSHCSELGGIIAILIMLETIAHCYSITSGKVTIRCDNDTAVDQSADDGPIKVDQKSFDYLQEIRNRLKVLPIEVEFLWVKGHKKGPKNWWHKRNDFCDRKAKEFLSKCTRGPKKDWRKHDTPKLFYERWAVYVHGVKLARIDKEYLYAITFGSKAYDDKGKSLLEYWKDHHDMPVGKCDLVDWELLRATRQSVSPGFNRWISKFSSGFIGNGNMLRHRGWQDSDKCPLCGKNNEKSSHVLTCRNTEAVKLFKKKIKEDLGPVLQEHKTNSYLTAAILEILVSHRKGRIKYMDYGKFDASIGDAFREQQQIGWHNFMMGRWSPRWQAIQARHYSLIRSRKSSKRWAIAICRELLQISWDMWQFRNGYVLSLIHI